MTNRADEGRFIGMAPDSVGSGCRLQALSLFQCCDLLLAQPSPSSSITSISTAKTVGIACLNIDANEQVPGERDALSWHHIGEKSRKTGTEFAFRFALEDIQHSLACDQLLRGRFVAALIDSAGAILDISPCAERASHSQCMLEASMVTSC